MWSFEIVFIGSLDKLLNKYPTYLCFDAFHIHVVV